MLQIQLSASFGIFLALLLLITETTLRGIRHPLVLERFRELKIRAPKPGFSFVLSMISSLISGRLWHSLCMGVVDTHVV